MSGEKNKNITHFRKTLSSNEKHTFVHVDKTTAQLTKVGKPCRLEVIDHKDYENTPEHM